MAERCENLVVGAVDRLHQPRFGEKAAGVAVHLGAGFQLLLDGGVQSAGCRGVASCPVNDGRLQGVHDLAHDVRGITPGEDEWNAKVCKPRCQLLQAAVVPPPGGRTERAWAVPIVVFFGPPGFVDPQCHHGSICC